MHHKRGKPKNSRAGCLMCKPWKANGCAGKARGCRFQTGALRAAYFARCDQRDG